MCGHNRGPDRNDQERTPGNSLDVAAETENEARDEIYDARGKPVVQVLQVDDYRNFLAEILTNDGDVLKVSRTHYRYVEAAAHGKLVARDFIITRNLTVILGSVAVLVNEEVIIVPDETEPITSITLRHADLRYYEPARGRPSGETMVSH